MQERDSSSVGSADAQRHESREGRGGNVYLLLSVLAPGILLGSAIAGGSPLSVIASLTSALPFLGMAAVPSLRLGREGTLPGQILTLFGGVMLVVNPMVVASSDRIFFPRSAFVPDWDDINAAIGLSSVAYVSALLGYLSRGSRSSEREYVRGSSAGLTTALVFACLGIVGIVLRVGSLEGLLAYLRGDVTGLALGETTLQGLLATVLPPFWTCALLIIWRVRSEQMVGGRRGVLILLAVLPMTLYSYNRAAVAIPLLCLLAASTQVRRPWPRGLVVVGGFAVGLSALAFGAWRRIMLGTAGGSVSVVQAGLDKPGLSPGQLWQLYSASPQFVASALNALEASGASNTVLSSVIGAIPYFGTGVRETSGPIIFNKMIYGANGNVDQILPAVAELHWSLPWIGVVVVFLLVGITLRHCSIIYSSTQDPVTLYFAMYLAVWTASLFVFSISIVLQIAVFFLYPVYVLGIRSFLVRRICRFR